MFDEKPQDKPAGQEDVAAKHQPEPANVPIPGEAALLRALRWLKTQSPVADQPTPDDPEKPEGG